MARNPEYLCSLFSSFSFSLFRNLNKTSHPRLNVALHYLNFKPIPTYTAQDAVPLSLLQPISDSLSIIVRVDAQFVGKTWFHIVQEGVRPTIFMPLFELGFGAGAGALGIADFSK